MNVQRRILFGIAIGICGAVWLHAQSRETKPSSADILRTFKTIYVQSKTPLAKPAMLAGELQKSSDFDKWGMSITSDPADADVVVEMDHQPGWFYYTYAMTHRSSGLVLVVGQVDAWDGKYASAKIARAIMKRCAVARKTQKDK